MTRRHILELFARVLLFRALALAIFYASQALVCPTILRQKVRVSLVNLAALAVMRVATAS